MIPAGADVFSIPPNFSASTFWRRFTTLFLLPQAFFAMVALPSEAPWLIGMLNGISLALSVGVCVAFVPAMVAIFFSPNQLEKGDYLSFGIWLTWLAVVMQAGWSIVWRSRGMPLWMANTDFTSYFLFMRTCGAVFHLAAPGAVDNRIPTRRWVMIGSLIAVAVALVLALGWVLNMVALRELARPLSYG